MRLEQLEFLLGVRKYGSMNNASKNMYVSQQAISHAIKELEEEYGVQLLERVIHKTILTDAGTIVADTAQVIFLQIAQMEAELQAFAGGPNEEVRDKETYTILINELLKNYYSNLIISVYQNHPASVIKMDDDPLADMVSKVIDREADIGFTFVTEHELKNFDSTQIAFCVLQKRPLYLYVADKSPLAVHKTLSLKTIAKYPIILFGQEDSKGSLIAKILNQYVPNQEVKYLNNIPMEVMSDIMATQQAVALRPRFGKDVFMTGCVEIKVKENIMIYSGYFYRKDTVLTLEYQEMLRVSII